MKFFSLINLKSFLLAIVPILGIYEIAPSVSLDFLFLAILLLLSFNKFEINKDIATYFFIVLLISLISYGLSPYQIPKLFINNTFQIVAFAILICFYTSTKINSLFIKTLQLFGIISTAVIVYQTISFWIFNTPVTFFIPINDEIIKLSETVSINYGRPNSIFKEPSHYSIYILPIFYYSLFTRRYYLAFFYLLGLFLSTSTTGFAAGIIIFFYYLFINKKTKKIILYVLPLVLLPLIFLKDSILVLLDKNLSKLDSNSMTENIRLFGTLPFFEKMDSFSIIFGLGHNQLGDFMTARGLEAYNYSNSYLMSIFSFGIIGLIAFVWLLTKLHKVNNNKAYFFILMLVLASDQILFNRNLFYLVTCVYFLQEDVASNTSLKNHKRIFNQNF
jgi:hypothetical protein